MSAPAAILLAAGEGRRMGGPKALLVVDGTPLVLAHVERLREIGCRPIVVVVRSAMVEHVHAVLGDKSWVQIVASDTSSMVASLVVGLQRGVPSAGQAVVVSTVDSLPVRRSTLSALLSALSENGVEVATPCHQGRGGHPVVVRGSLLQALLRGYPGTLRDLIRSAEAQRVRLAVDDPAVTIGLDTPADLAAARPGLTPWFALTPRADLSAPPAPERVGKGGSERAGR